MSEARQIARMFLNGVGDPALGEWEEAGAIAPGPRRYGFFHVRRRLSAAEQEQFGIAGVRDVRGLPEERERLRALLADAPHLRQVFA